MNKRLSLLLLLASTGINAAAQESTTVEQTPTHVTAVYPTQEFDVVTGTDNVVNQTITTEETTTTHLNHVTSTPVDVQTTSTEVKHEVTEEPLKVVTPSRLAAVKNALSNAATSTKDGVSKAASYTVTKAKTAANVTKDGVVKAASYTANKAIAAKDYANNSLKVDGVDKDGNAVRVYSKVRVAAAVAATALVVYGIYKLATRPSQEDDEKDSI